MKRETVLSKRRDPIILLAVALVLSMAALLWLGWHVHGYLGDATTRRERDSRIEELRAVMVHLDEVLTMSALMAATTGDLRWEERYRQFEPKLDAAIKDAIALAPEAQSAEAAATTDAANIALVEMENRAFNLVRDGRADQAATLLLSDEYETQKRLYTQGMLWFHPRRPYLRLLQLRGMVVHMDEVLTMSARMAAATGDLRWEERYRQFEPKLDAAIKEAIALAPEVQSAEAAATTDAANIALVEMENRAFDLVRGGRADEAMQILFSDDYETQKQVYAKGMTDFASGLATSARTSREREGRRALFHLILALVPIPLALVSWLVVLRATRKWRAALAESNRGLARQAEELAQLNQALDRKVAERTSELSNANEELKREIADRERAEERFRILFESSRDAIMTLAPPSWRFTSGNPATVSMFGAKDEAEFTSLGPWEVSPEYQPDGRPSDEKAKEMIETAMREGSHFFEWTHKRLDGEDFPATVLLTRMETGGQTMLQATVRDITDRNRLEHELRRLAVIAEQAAEGIAVADTEGNLQFVNPAWARMHGYESGAALVGKHLGIFHTDEQMKTDVIPFNDVVSRRGQHAGEVGHVRKDGTTFPAHMQVVMLKDEDGKPYGLSGFAQDITERKQAEEKLTATNRVLGERVKELNALYELSRIAERHEMTPRQVLQEAVALLPPAWQYPEIACGRIRFDGEVFETRPGAESHWRQSAAIRVGGQERGCVEVCYLEERPESDEGPFMEDERVLIDALARRLGYIMQRKEAQEALARSNTELEQFAYVASHDLQEPLRMVTGYVQMLARRYKGQLDADADDFIAFAVDGAQRMSVLINDLLSYSRVTTRGKDFVPTDCEAIMENVLADFQLAIEESGAVVTHDPLPTILADDVQMGRVVQNLVGNAIKYHGDEPPRVHVSAERQGEEWRFGIRDNGIGIAPEHRERIFIIFQRLHARDEYAGTGIGLAICKKTVERHGGRIWVESEPGQGSTFYFTVPIREAEANEHSSDDRETQDHAHQREACGNPVG